MVKEKVDSLEWGRKEVEMTEEEKKFMADVLSKRNNLIV